MKFDVLCLGEALIDNITVNNTNIPNPGGAPFNVACIVSYFNLKSSFIGRIGNDQEGQIIISTMNKFNVDQNNIIIDKYHPTTQAYVTLDSKGDRSFTFNRETSADIQLTINDINKNSIINTRIFHFGSLSLVNKTYEEATKYALEIAKENNVIISYDPNYRKPLWKSEKEAINAMCRYLHFVDILKISLDELYLITNENNLDLALHKLNIYNLKIILVTDGDNGAYLKYNNEVIKIDTIKVDTIDTTAAGDIFFGTFLSLIIKNNISLQTITIDNIINYTKIACINASISTTYIGGISSILKLKNTLD